MLRGAGSFPNFQTFRFASFNFTIFFFNFQLIIFKLLNFIFQSFQFAKFQTVQNSGFRKVRYTNLRTFSYFRFSDMKIIFPRMFPLFSCACDKYWVLWSRFGEHVRSSKNHLKSIAIRPESLIGDFGNIYKSIKAL